MAQQRRRLPRGLGGLLRHEIVAAAERVVAGTEDSRGLTIRAVAAEAGVTAPSIYRHFADKRTLAQAVIDSRFEHFGAALSDAVVGGVDPFDRLRRRCHAYLTYAREQSTWYRVLFSDVSMGWEPGVDLSRPGFATFNEHVEAVRSCLEWGSAQIADSADPFRVALLLWAGLHGLAELPVTKPGISWPPVEELVDDLLAALGLAAGVS